MKNVIYVDSSGADSLAELVRTCRRHHVRLILCGLNHQPLDIARRSGLLQLFAPPDLQTDLASGIAAALDQTVNTPSATADLSGKPYPVSAPTRSRL